MDEQTNKVKINLNVLGAGMKDNYKKKKKKKGLSWQNFLNKKGEEKRKSSLSPPEQNF